MALIGNGVRYAGNPGRTSLGGASVYSVCRYGQQNGGSIRNILDRSSAWRDMGVPEGYAAPSAWMLPQIDGGLASRGEIAGEGEVSDAALFSSVPLSAALAGTGAITDAAAAVVIQLVATLAGTGALSADAVATLNLSASLAGSGDLEGSLGLIAGLVGALAGTGTVSANLKGYANLEADITPFTELSPQTLAAAVWNALAAELSSPGTMGEKMNAAGTAGDPWTAAMGSYAEGSAGRALVELYRLAGLDPTKPLVVTTSRRTAGDDIDQTISEAAGTVTVTRSG